MNIFFWLFLVEWPSQIDAVMALAAEKEKSEELEARVNLLEQEVRSEEWGADGGTDQGETGHMSKRQKMEPSNRPRYPGWLFSRC